MEYTVDPEVLLEIKETFNLPENTPLIKIQEHILAKLGTTVDSFNPELTSYPNVIGYDSFTNTMYYLGVSETLFTTEDTQIPSDWVDQFGIKTLVVIALAAVTEDLESFYAKANKKVVFHKIGRDIR